MCLYTNSTEKIPPLLPDDLIELYPDTIACIIHRIYYELIKLYLDTVASIIIRMHCDCKYSISPCSFIFLRSSPDQLEAIFSQIHYDCLMFIFLLVFLPSTSIFSISYHHYPPCFHSIFFPSFHDQLPLELLLLFGKNFFFFLLFNIQIPSRLHQIFQLI